MALLGGVAATALMSAAMGCDSGTSTRVIEHGPREHKVVALTFDDGPSQYTKRILKILKNGRVAATFFPIGNDLTKRARALGMATISGEVDPRDWELPGTDAIVSTVLGKVKNGSIVILHDGGDGPRTQTIAALPRILAGLRQRGYRTVTVTQLLGYKKR